MHLHIHVHQQWCYNHSTNLKVSMLTLESSFSFLISKHLSWYIQPELLILLPYGSTRSCLQVYRPLLQLGFLPQVIRDQILNGYLQKQSNGFLFLLITRYYNRVIIYYITHLDPFNSQELHLSKQLSRVPRPHLLYWIISHIFLLRLERKVRILFYLDHKRSYLLNFQDILNHYIPYNGLQWNLLLSLLLFFGQHRSRWL